MTVFLFDSFFAKSIGSLKRLKYGPSLVSLMSRLLLKDLSFIFNCRLIYLSYKFSKFQQNSLAFNAGIKRATDEGSLPEIAFTI